MVLSQDSDWWFGYVDDDDSHKGYFPGNYVELLPREIMKIKVSS